MRVRHRPPDIDRVDFVKLLNSRRELIVFGRGDQAYIGGDKVKLRCAIVEGYDLVKDGIMCACRIPRTVAKEVLGIFGGDVDLDHGSPKRRWCRS